MRKVDYRGVECPEPLIKVTREIARLPEGAQLIVLTDIHQCVNMIKEAVEGLGLGTVTVNEKEGYYELIVTVGE